MKSARRTQLHLERLVGKKVRDTNGRSAGRIEEIHAVQRDGECYVHEYHLGRGALLERLSVSSFATLGVALLGGRNNRATHRVAWDGLDLTDPEHPKLRFPRDEMEAIPRGA